LTPPSNLFDDEICKERFDDLNAGHGFFFGGVERDELILACETSPELLDLMGIETLFPIKKGQG
jgi:hypothetical protein